jgi:hypothetical protein
VTGFVCSLSDEGLFLNIRKVLLGLKVSNLPKFENLPLSFFKFKPAEIVKASTANKEVKVMNDFYYEFQSYILLILQTRVSFNLTNH